MATLHIEHAISGYELWKSAFDRFSEFRQQSGVRRHRILQPIDNSQYVVVELDFGTVEEANKFLEFLQARVWASPETAPALIGSPQTRVLELVEDH